MECGDFDDVELKTVKLDSDERVIGMKSRTFGQNKCTHFDVKFKIAKFVWIESLVKAWAEHFFWFIVLYFCQQLVPIKIHLSLISPVFELLIITSQRIQSKSILMLFFNLSLKVFIHFAVCMAEELDAFNMLLSVPKCLVFPRRQIFILLILGQLNFSKEFGHGSKFLQLYQVVHPDKFIFVVVIRHFLGNSVIACLRFVAINLVHINYGLFAHAAWCLKEFFLAGGAPRLIKFVNVVPFLLPEELIELGSALCVCILKINMIFIWWGLALLSCSKNFPQLSRPNKALNFRSGKLPFPLLNIDHIFGIKFLNELELPA